MELSSPTDKILICSITPYFLEKGNFWFEKNLNKILPAIENGGVIFAKQVENSLRGLRKIHYEYSSQNINS